MTAWPRFSAALWTLLLLSGSEVGAESITSARYELPAERYGHFALGRPHEYARLSVITDQGRTLSLDLPEDEVFEDLQPRPVRLRADAPLELLTIVSQRKTGARLVLFAVVDGKLAMSAQSAPIGTPNRWLNPIGAADLDGDGEAEVAAVITPHIGGTLKIYRRRADQLVEVAARFGFSNHVYGSAELALAAIVPVASGKRLVVPDARRGALLVLAWQADQLVETARCELPAQVDGALRHDSASHIGVPLSNGSTHEMARTCLK